MLSKKLHEAMNAQINAELWSAYLYLSMSMDAEAKGLKGASRLLYGGYADASSSSIRLFSLLLKFWIF